MHNIIKVENQKQDTYYEMELVFKLNIEVIGVIGANYTIEIKMHQVAPFVPDKETIQKYADVIKETYLKSSTELTCTTCEFDRYNYLYMIETPSETEGADVKVSDIKTM